MTQIEAEEHRVRTVYRRRDNEGKPALYLWHRQEVLFSQYRFRATAASMLVASGLVDFSQVEILDVGCGIGGWLRTLLEWGAPKGRLHGVDLLADRIKIAKALSPDIDFQVASGYSLPFCKDSMDLVCAFTVFSSTMEAGAREALAAEMMRVLQNSGMILLYDYRISDPGNLDTVGIRKAEICRLFPNFSLQLRSITLAPPISRRITRLPSLVAHALECLFPFLRTHAVYILNDNKSRE